MTYQARRSNTVEEVLELLDESNKVVHTLKIKIDADAVAKAAREQYVNLIHAEQNLRDVAAKKDSELKEYVESAQEVAGNALVTLYRTVLGEENTDIILEFYVNRFMEMHMEVTPFVTQVLIPKINDTVRVAKNRIANQYKRNKGYSSKFIRRGI